ncbi:hypothetical protein SARC_13790 [Sphaeroforma arctica JP610]|uniref:Alcohol dehydrogenase-like C-terminal domain-containing protein n=1 Tax=Sphaeroforma arctica JP610 TaxID=667725 RepID=A0A0L0FAX5_9EUKA|nr:hypothetical protein SARC_13790 [Sphaeroforma arctica JP610]KNC73651.1 hypothetical protein SARC_13790 [Sphaeroforma arctica JP610]|eukprot:XP_014147553.1 hypothetical protein SARC_13790 [Sphaeroforma arctica JP610]
MKSAAGSLDLILDTCPYAPENGDMSPWMDLLCFGGTYCRLGLPEVSTATFNFNFIPLVFTAKKIVGSIVCGSKNTTDMLRLAAVRGIDCDVEVMPISEVNVAMKTLEEGKNTESRIVLQW